MMKKTIILVLWLLAGFYGFAQSGLYNLDYSMPFCDADTTLKALNLVCNDHSSIAKVNQGEAASLVYYAQENCLADSALSRIVLYYHKDNPLLMSWVGYYIAPRSDSLETKLREQLVSKHGAGYHTESGEKIWEIDKLHFVSLGYVTDSYYVWYQTKK